MSRSGDREPGRAQEDEGAMIGVLAPHNASRLRLILMAALLIIWIAVLLGLYLATPHLQKGPSPSSGMTMAFER